VAASCSRTHPTIPGVLHKALPSDVSAVGRSQTAVLSLTSRRPAHPRLGQTPGAPALVNRACRRSHRFDRIRPVLAVFPIPTLVFQRGPIGPCVRDITLAITLGWA